MSRIRSELNLLNLIPTSEWLGYWRAHQSCVCIKDKTGNLKGQWLIRIAEILGFWSSQGFSCSTMAVRVFARQEQAQSGYRVVFADPGFTLPVVDWSIKSFEIGDYVFRGPEEPFDMQLITSVRGRRGQVPPRWVGSELVLSEVNNRVFRPLCFSVPYSQTFSVKTV